MNLLATIIIFTSIAGVSGNDFYEYRHVVAAGVQKALLECREKFKLDRWNCPKQAFLDILRRHPLPPNKELGLTRALISAGIVLSLTRTCSYGTDNFCGCNQPNTTGDQNATGSEFKETKFLWNGCDESVKFAFKVSKIYLETQDLDNQDEASRRVNAHNFEVGRLAIKDKLKKHCRCHGVSGTCQVKTCWSKMPDMNVIGDYLKRKYRSAAKVGAMTAVESNIVSLNKELTAISKDKMLFIDASPDYCYENASLGINGTLGRYCIPRDKKRTNGTELSRYERESCDRLCTECGYRVKRELIEVDRQCQCKFVYCCSVQCKRCPAFEEVYKCVRHS